MLQFVSHLSLLIGQLSTGGEATDANAHITTLKTHMMSSRSSLALVAVALLCLTSTGDCHGWLSYPESRNSKLNTVAPTGLAYNRMNGNGRAAWFPLLPIAQPGMWG